MVPTEGTYLVSTGTWLEVAVLDVEFLHAERTGIISVVAVKHSVRLHDYDLVVTNDTSKVDKSAQNKLDYVSHIIFEEVSIFITLIWL
jgi:hypothetical protein